MLRNHQGVYMSSNNVQLEMKTQSQNLGVMSFLERLN
uniref:Uncharacterized protein n=1 Tax=Arundo donax TaxID=35708 RepID=A0A0A8Z1U4_ARUDO